MIPKISEAKEKIKEALYTILKDEEIGEWIVERRNPEEVRQRFSQKALALMSFDVDKIKDLVFASTKPLEVQGASEIVRDLTRCGERQPDCSVYSVVQDFGVSRANVLFAGGGTGLMLVPAERAREIAEEIKRRFAGHSITGSCSVVWREFRPHELITGPESSSQRIDGLPPDVSIISGDSKDGIEFGKIIQLLADQLREEKDRKLAQSLLILPGFIHVCESCGVRAAAHYDDPGQRDWICYSCGQHRQRGRDEITLLKRRDEEVLTAESINDIIGESAGGRGYVAVIYADANGMGQMLFELESLEEYAVFSSVVSHVMDKVTRRLIVEHKLKGKYQSPIVGGDDILMIVPASKAAKIVSDLMKWVPREFEEAAKCIEAESKILPKKLCDITMSVGFVIVPSHFNIRFSVEYAEALLRTAKSGRYEKCEECIDWMVIKEGSPLSTEVRDLRETTLIRDANSWKLTLTDKPVTVSRFDDMRGWIKLLKQHRISNHQLKNMQSSIEQDSPLLAKLNMRYQWLRVQEWKEFFHSLKDMDMDGWLDKFVMQEVYSKVYKTGFIDMMELYEFAEA